jgi:hypothetical protein
MTIRSNILGKSKLLMLLMAAVAADGVCRAAGASDLAAQNYLQTLTNPDITATVNAGASLPPGKAAKSVMLSHARAARALFGEARAAMERGFMLGETTPKANVAAVESAMKDLRLHLAILQGTAKPRTAAVVKKASALAQDWYEAGLLVIKPSDGVLELPSPVSVHNKANAVIASLELVIDDAVGALAAPPRQARAPKRRPQKAAAAPRPVGDSADLANMLGFNRDTH